MALLRKLSGGSGPCSDPATRVCRCWGPGGRGHDAAAARLDGSRSGWWPVGRQGTGQGRRPGVWKARRRRQSFAPPNAGLRRGGPARRTSRLPDIKGHTVGKGMVTETAGTSSRRYTSLSSETAPTCYVLMLLAQLRLGGTHGRSKPGGPHRGAGERWRQGSHRTRTKVCSNRDDGDARSSRGPAGFQGDVDDRSSIAGCCSSGQTRRRKGSAAGFGGESAGVKGADGALFCSMRR